MVQYIAAVITVAKFSGFWPAGCDDCLLERLLATRRFLSPNWASLQAWRDGERDEGRLTGPLKPQNREGKEIREDNDGEPALLICGLKLGKRASRDRQG